MSLPVALQLYTLREVDEDFTDILEKVAEIGYDGVEFAGYGGLEAQELKKTLDNLNLQATASHVGYNELTENLQEVIDFNLTIGNKYIVCPYLEFSDIDDLKEKTEQFNIIGEKCRDNDLVFCYHNHAHEFEQMGSSSVIELLLSKTDSSLVKFEVDTYWVKKAGYDPIAFIKKYKERIPLVHLKDMEDNENRDFAEVGTGIMPMKELVNLAQNIKSEWLIVEQDQCKKPPLESVKISYNNLQKF